MTYKDSIQKEKRKQDFIKTYSVLKNRYTGTLYNDRNEFIGNSQFGISKSWYDKITKDKECISKKEVVSSYLDPWLEDRHPTPDWRSVDGVSGKWQKYSVSKTGRVFVQSIRKLNTHTAIDFDFCKLFPNHWFMHNADYISDNKKNDYPIFAHNKETGELDGYIFPVREYRS